MPSFKKNHYVPSWLLRRFSSRKDGSTYRIWQLAANRQPVEPSILDVCHGKYFYGRDGAVERALEDRENRDSRLLSWLDSGSNPNERLEELRSVVWRLALRTRGLRAFAEQATLGGITALARKFGIEAIVRDPRVSGALQDVLKDPVERVHNAKLLAAVQDDEQVPPAFWPFDWQVVIDPEDQFVLGDSGVFVLPQNGGPRPLIGHHESIREVYLPVSSTQVLVGRIVPGPATLGTREINKASAAVSLDFVYCSSLSEDVRGLEHTIGSSSSLIDQDEWDEVIERAVRNSGSPQERGASHLCCRYLGVCAPETGTKNHVSRFAHNRRSTFPEGLKVPQNQPVFVLPRRLLARNRVCLRPFIDFMCARTFAKSTTKVAEDLVEQSFGEAIAAENRCRE